MEAVSSQHIVKNKKKKWRNYRKISRNVIFCHFIFPCNLETVQPVKKSRNRKWAELAMPTSQNTSFEMALLHLLAHLSINNFIKCLDKIGPL